MIFYSSFLNVFSSFHCTEFLLVHIVECVHAIIILYEVLNMSSPRKSENLTFLVRRNGLTDLSMSPCLPIHLTFACVLWNICLFHEILR